MNLLKKITAILLSVVLVFTMIPVFTSAKEVKESTGTFKCAWFNETLTYPYEYSDEYLKGSIYEYNNDLALYCLCVAMSSFNSFDKEKGDEHIKALFEECGYDVKSYGYETEGYDTAAISVGRKVIDGMTVLICAIRSGNYGMEWGGNMRIGSGTGDHEGFEIGKDISLLYLNRYFKENPVSGKVKLVIPGYSRGASIANLMAAAIDDGTYTDVLNGEKDYIKDVDFEMTAYTFEAPQCTTSKNTRDAAYNNIFNIVNPNDYVPMFVMNEYGFSHYGKRVELPGADNCDNYDEYYERVCAVFDSFMGVNDRKAKDCFYDEEHSRSVETTLNYIFAGLGEEVMIDREYYHENYENALVFFAGQYLGRKRTAKDFARTMGLIAIATAICIKPKNLEKIKSDGFRKYLSEYLAEKNGGELSSKDIEGTLNILTGILEYLSENRKDVTSLLGQINTVLQVHQPFVALSWLRTLTDEDIHEINGDFDSVLRLSCSTMKLKYNVDGKLVARYDESLGHVEWTTSDEAVVSVTEDGVVHGNGKGTAVITAVLYTDDGVKLEDAQTQVTIEMNPLLVFWKSIKSLVK